MNPIEILITIIIVSFFAVMIASWLCDRDRIENARRAEAKRVDDLNKDNQRINTGVFDD